MAAVTTEGLKVIVGAGLGGVLAWLAIKKVATGPIDQDNDEDQE